MPPMPFSGNHPLPPIPTPMLFIAALTRQVFEAVTLFLAKLFSGFFASLDEELL